MKFIKKHPICSKFLLVLFIFYSVVYLRLYFVEFRYYPDGRDFRYYSLLPLSEKWTKVIEYQTVPKVKFAKCFQLEVNVYYLYRKFSEKYHYDTYLPKYNLYAIKRLTDEQAYIQSQEKPQFLINIYKNNKLIKSDHVYFLNKMASHGIKFEDLNITLNDTHPNLKDSVGDDGEISLYTIEGYKGAILSKKPPSACYNFEANTQYKIEITNKNLITEYDDVEIYFSIRPVLYK